MLSTTDHQTTDLVLPAVVALYFEAFNRGNSEALTALFDPQALLIAPVNIRVRSATAIVAYIAEKGRGMSAEPEVFEGREDSIAVLGHVRGPAFRVRAAWVFQLSGGRIARLRVRLLASMQEMLRYQDQYESFKV